MSPASPRLYRTIGALAIITALAAFCLAVIVARSWNASRQAASDMHVVFRAQTPVFNQAQQREQQRDAALSKNLAAISKAERQAKKPEDIAHRLPAAFPLLPHPLAVNLAPPSDTTGPEPPGPEPPAIISVPREDLKPLFDRLEECRACQEQLVTAQQDLSDERAKVSALMIERDAAVKAARGGGFWSRFRTGVKWFVIGGALGALGASAVHR